MSPCVCMACRWASFKPLKTKKLIGHSPLKSKMSSRLETVPRDILQLIAFLTTSSSVFEPPVQIQRLLLSSSYIYESLHLHAAPHVFAQIFQSKFDSAALFRRYSTSLTQSLLAEELSNRCRLLRRARRMDFSPVHLTQDLWAALCLIVESDGLNERQLLNSNFPAFILRLAFNHLQEAPDRRPVDQHIIVWLLSLALPRRTPLLLFMILFVVDLFCQGLF